MKTISLWILFASPLFAMELPQKPVVDGPARQSTVKESIQKLTMEEAMHMALKNNPLLGKTKLDVDLAIERKRQTVASVLPKIGIVASATKNSKEAGFGSPEDRTTVLHENDWSYGIHLSQPVFAGFRDLMAIKQQKLVIKAAGNSVHFIEENLLFKVAFDYLRLENAEILESVNLEVLALAKERLKYAEDRFFVGEVTRLDVLRATMAIKDAERHLTETTRNIGIALGYLRIDLGKDIDSIETVTPVALRLELPEATELERLAVSRRADLATLRSQSEMASLEIKKKKGAYYPVIRFEAGYQWQKSLFPSDNYGYAGLRFSLPVYESGETKSRVAQARIQERQIHLEIEHLQRMVREEVRRALLDVRASKRGYELALDGLKVAEAEYKQTSDLYLLGEVTSLDFEAAATSLAKAKRESIRTQLDLFLAKLGAWHVAGSLKSIIFEVQTP